MEARDDQLCRDRVSDRREPQMLEPVLDHHPTLLLPDDVPQMRRPLTHPYAAELA